MSSEFSSDLDLLKTEPTSSGWEVELRRIIRGERGYALVELGSADEFVREVLLQSSDPSTAKTFFDEALRNVVQSWQPSSLEAPTEAARMLDLISASTPDGGSIKVMDFISKWSNYGSSRVSASIHGTRQDLRLKALVTLSNYYRKAPPLREKDLAFVSYVRILREYLLNPQFAAYALRRLLDLEVVQPMDPEVSRLIQLMPQSLSEIIPLVLDRRRQSSIQAELSSIFTYCVNSGNEAVNYFRESIYANKAEIISGGGGPEIRLRTGELVALILDVRVQARYLDIEQEASTLEGIERFKGIVAVHMDYPN